MPIKEYESNLESKINEAVQTELAKIKDQIGVASIKLKPEQHLRFILNTIDQRINELKDEAKNL